MVDSDTFVGSNAEWHMREDFDKLFNRSGRLNEDTFGVVFQAAEALEEDDDLNRRELKSDLAQDSSATRRAIGDFVANNREILRAQGRGVTPRMEAYLDIAREVPQDFNTVGQQLGYLAEDYGEPGQTFLGLASSQLSPVVMLEDEEYWPDEYPTLMDTARALDEVGLLDSSTQYEGNHQTVRETTDFEVSEEGEALANALTSDEHVRPVEEAYARLQKEDIGRTEVKEVSVIYESSASTLRDIDGVEPVPVEDNGYRAE